MEPYTMKPEMAGGRSSPQRARPWAPLLVVLIAAPAPSTPSDRPEPGDSLHDPGLHIFADDVEIERMWDVSRVLGKPQNSTEPVLSADRPWETERVIFNFCGSVLYDPSVRRFRMWYAAIPKGPPDPNLPELTCYAQSDDGVRWNKPALGLLEYRGSRENNIVYTTAGTALSNYRFCVVRDDSDPDPAKRYKGFGAVWPLGYHLVTSPDGLRWSTPPRLVQTAGGDTFGLTWDPARKLFLHVARGAVPDKDNLLDDPVTRMKRVLGIFESRNLERWRYQGLAIDLDDDDGFGRRYQHWTMQPFNYGNQYLGLVQISAMRSPALINRVELMSSRDGRSWRYVSRHQEFMSRGPHGDWDATREMLLTAGPPVPAGELIHLYFTARQREAWYLGMARLRRDRFVGLRSGEGQRLASRTTRGYNLNLDHTWDGWQVPYVFTKEVRVSGPKLQLNLQTGSGGAVRVSVHRRYVAVAPEERGGQILEGLGAGDCTPLQGDGTRLDVRWKDHPDLRHLVGQEVALMFHLKNATLWSYRFAQ
jgi:hypothetical protein